MRPSICLRAPFLVILSALSAHNLSSTKTVAAVQSNSLDLFETGTFIGQQIQRTPQARMLFDVSDAEPNHANESKPSATRSANHLLPCGDGDEIYFRGYCYYFQQIPPLTWQEASDFCTHSHSQLVYVDSYDENLWLLRKIPDIFGEYRIAWLGLTETTATIIKPDANISKAPQLLWSDKSVPEFINVIQDLPSCLAGDNRNLFPSALHSIRRPFCRGTGRCFALYTWPDAGFGFWTDQACDGRKAFICKRPAPSLAVLATSAEVDEKIKTRFAEIRSELNHNCSTINDAPQHRSSILVAVSSSENNNSAQAAEFLADVKELVQAVNVSMIQLDKRVQDAERDLAGTRELQSNMIDKFDQRFRNLKIEQVNLARRLADLEGWRGYVNQQIFSLTERSELAFSILHQVLNPPPSLTAFGGNAPTASQQQQRPPRQRVFTGDKNNVRPSGRQEELHASPDHETMASAISAVRKQIQQANQNPMPESMASNKT